MTLRTIARMETYMLQIDPFRSRGGRAGAALAPWRSRSGDLYSVLSYVIRAAIPSSSGDCCVRMALAPRDRSTRSVASLVFSQGGAAVAFENLSWSASLAARSSLAVIIRAISTEMRSVVHVLDPVAYVVSVLTIVAACALASSIPALRAARLDPMRILRES